MQWWNDEESCKTFHFGLRCTWRELGDTLFIDENWWEYQIIFLVKKMFIYKAIKIFCMYISPVADVSIDKAW